MASRLLLLAGIRCASALEVKDILGPVWFKREVLRIGPSVKRVTKGERYLWRFLGIEDGSLCPVFGFEECPYFLILLQLFTSLCCLTMGLLLHQGVESISGWWSKPRLKEGDRVCAKFYETSDYMWNAMVMRENGDGTFHLKYETESEFHAVPRDFILASSKPIQAAEGTQPLDGIQALMGWQQTNAGRAFDPCRSFPSGVADKKPKSAWQIGSFITYVSDTDLERVVEAERRRLDHQYGLASAALDVPREGMPVKAMFMRPSSRWYPAVVRAKNANGTYWLQYENGKEARHVLVNHILPEALRHDETDPYLRKLNEFQDSMERQEPEEEEEEQQCCITPLITPLHTFRSWNDSNDRLLTALADTIDSQRLCRQAELDAITRLKKQKRAVTFTMIYWAFQIVMAALDLIKVATHAKVHIQHASLGLWASYNLLVYGYVHSAAFTTVLHAVSFYMLEEFENSSQISSSFNIIQRQYADVSSIQASQMTFKRTLRAILGVLMLPVVPMAFTHILPFVFFYPYASLVCFFCGRCLASTWHQTWEWHVKHKSPTGTSPFTFLPYVVLVVCLQTFPSACTRVWAGETRFSLAYYLDPVINDYQSRTWRSEVRCDLKDIEAIADFILRWT